MSRLQSLVDNGNMETIIKRIIEIAQPEKIIVFGSTARDDTHPGSDLDLLVIKSGVHRRKLAQKLYLNLFGIEQAVDIIVVTPEDIDKYKNSIGLVIETALREGKVVYERKSSASR